MSNDPKTINIINWVKEAKSDPVKHRVRQVTEIVLAAIGQTEELKENLYLKGGALMSLSHNSPRSTADLDLTALKNPIPFGDELEHLLNQSMQSAARRLGYIDLVCKVQRVRRHPRPNNFSEASNPAMSLKIGSAKRGSSEEENLKKNNAPQVLEIDVTFKEPVHTCEILALDGSEITVQAYGLLDLMAEKLRSLLQQPIRNRRRRQDVFDINLLLDTYGPFDDDKKRQLLRILIEKSAARELPVDSQSFKNPKISEMAKETWGSLQQELATPLPDFDELFTKVQAFYESLPWQE